jgi:hypothetical protein
MISSYVELARAFAITSSVLFFVVSSPVFPPGLAVYTRYGQRSDDKKEDGWRHRAKREPRHGYKAGMAASAHPDGDGREC